MKDKFNKLTEEKQNNIINSAINEFGEKGYNKASTDIIAANSQIAKGSLFYYFGNKKNLYLYIVEHCLKFTTEKILNGMNSIESEDFYKRIAEASLMKQKLLVEYPLYTNIIMEAFMNMPEDLKEDLGKMYVEYHTSSMKILEEYIISYLDTDSLKPSVTKEEAVFVNLSLFEALSKKYTAMYKGRMDELMNNPEEMFKDFEKYIDIIKYGIYK